MGNTEISMVWWTRAVGVFTGLLFLVGALQLWDLYETNNFNRRALIAIQAPFVFVKNPIFSPSFGPSKEISWHILTVWQNSGNTATYNLFVDVYCHPSVTIVPNPWAFRDTETISRFRRTLGPKQDTGGGFCQFPAADIIKMQHGDLHLYITARAAYGDNFEPLYTHVTEYCAELIDIKGDPNISSKLTALDNPCTSHNCADDECKTQ
jgi:hypothetical protein